MLGARRREVQGIVVDCAGKPQPGGCKGAGKTSRATALSVVDVFRLLCCRSGEQMVVIRGVEVLVRMYPEHQNRTEIKKLREGT